MLSVSLLLLSLVLVTLGAEALVRGASLLALRVGVSPLFVGLTIVGFGTSSPELSASLAATLQGASGVSVGNVVGSNIFNIAVILGVAAAFRPIRIEFAAIRRDVAVAVGAATVPWIALAFDGRLPRVVGSGFVGVLIVYLVVAYVAGRRASVEVTDRARDETVGTFPVRTEGPSWKHHWVVNAGLIVVGLALLVQGSRWFVGSAIDVAQWIGASELLIGLTIVAAGTSLPELMTSLVATCRGNTDIAVGNVIGSNIFNAFGILGICSVVRPQEVGSWVLTMDVPVMLISTLALVPLMRTGGVISRREGWSLLLGYLGYVCVLMLRDN
jgi:cation:H+ antiporter